MKTHQPREETGRVLAVAAALWGSVVALAALEGAFSRFDAAALGALAAFVSLFAAANSRSLSPEVMKLRRIDRFTAGSFDDL